MAIEIKSQIEAEEKQKAGGVLLEVRGTGADRVYVFEDEAKDEPKKEAKKKDEK